MPLPMIHLSVAVNVEKIITPEKMPMFLLGSISPDAIHMRAGADRVDKRKTHCIGETREETIENVRNMLSNSKSMKEENLKTFILGYCTHILTDVIWADTVHKGYINTLTDIGLKNQSKILYYKETDTIDFKIFREVWWRRQVWEQFSISEPPKGFDLLTFQELEKWKVRTLTWFEDEGKDPKITPQYITEDIIKTFISNASAFVYKEILTYGV